ncbi:bacterial Ig-like domain-containing protein [Alkalihalobacterium bogoriense]|uniref:bacterial Ig-like domain-containing protein n=1 Tax=Alkalihalobacterium bogoriense TaxID=246272 RepID=UPI000684D525|nr:bacterial Ig-like domain-containing protein [Alkalihalobacterium bogoriense]
MEKRKSWVAFILAIVLAISPLHVAVLAEEQSEKSQEQMIQIQSDWNGAVFGDNGGQANITYENFEITEHELGTVTLRSTNNRGKIASSSEGIAYYYKEVESSDNFEITAKARVEEWTANNQVSFGIMVRGNVLDNENDSTFTGDYVAVGALDQQMKGFYKYKESSIQKNGFEFQASPPLAGEEYQLSIQKLGELYILKVDDEIQTIEHYNGDIHFAGLYTSRNTTVTFTDVQLNIVNDEIDIGEWEFRAFGGNTSEERNPGPVTHEDGAVTLTASGGKIASGDEGLSFMFKEIPADANFLLTTKAEVRAFNQNANISTPNQKSFGLMLRDEIGQHLDSTTVTSHYVAVGALDTVMKGFYKQAGNQTKRDAFQGVSVPTNGEEYELSIRKSGNTYVVSTNGQQEVIIAEDLFHHSLYAGVYVARDAEVTFRDFDIVIDRREVNELQIDTSQMKTEYLVGEQLDMSNVVVKAIFSDGTEQVLQDSDYIVTGFDNSTPGTNTITLHYQGATATIDLKIIALTLTELSISFYPAKTNYYIGDSFRTEGLTIIGKYENGYKEELSNADYVLTIDGEGVEQYTFSEPGRKTVTVTAKEASHIQTTFSIVVIDAELTSVTIKQLPQKTVYFLEEDIDLAGLRMYATYSNGNEVRLLPDEYEVAPLDTSFIGEKDVEISHKGITTSFSVIVKEKELIGLEITEYPTTTYTIGESFNSTGLEVSKVYDNGETEVYPKEQYRVDSSRFDSSKKGTYDIVIVPTDPAIQAISLFVTVREVVDYEWNSIVFGQSTSSQRNYIETLDDGTVRLVALEGGGKITGDHDGVSYFYTEIDATEDNFTLSADLKVVEYAKEPHDGQESFGLMARDAINSVQDASVFASNIAAVGGYSGGTRNPNGTQGFIRTGVLAPDGEGSEGIQSYMLKQGKPNLSSTHPEQPYRLTLTKTNSGYTMALNDGEEVIFYEPDILHVQDEKVYVGFYTARLATIEVSNIDFRVTAVKTDKPKVDPPQQPINPSIDILSLDKTAETEYDLLLRSNVDGVVTVKRGQEEIVQEQEIVSGEKLQIPTTINENDRTNLTIVFLPDDTQFLTVYHQIVKNFSVEHRLYRNGEDIYVSPDGESTGEGTKGNPLDLDTAIDFLQKGQAIIVQEGHYVRQAPLEIKKYNDGSENALKYLLADPDAEERPLVDFDRKSEGVVHSGDYWHVIGIDFAKSAGNTKGYTIGGSHNIVENVRVFEHGDTGLQISRTDPSTPREEWPAFNTVLNSVSFDNRDPSENNADGFAAKLTVGEGNVFSGSIAHNNIDDGWDLYTKVGTGAIGAVTIENSIAFHNGTLTNGYEGNAGKNGFKLGGEGVHVGHVIKNSIAFENGYFGFTSNSNPGVIAENNIGVNNKGANLSFTTYAQIPTDFTIDGFVSYQTKEGKKERDRFPTPLKSNRNYMFDGDKSVNEAGDILPDDIFDSVQALFEYDSQGRIVSVKRDEDGNILWDDVWDKFSALMNASEEELPPGGEEEELPPGGEEELPPGGEEEELPPGGEEEELPPGGEEEKLPPGGEEEKLPPEGEEEELSQVPTLDGKNKLPITYTTMYNWLFLGILLLVFGVWIARKKQKQTF